MKQSCFDILKFLVEKGVDDDMKAAAKNVFKRKYGDEWFTVSTECVTSFTLDLKYLEHFGDAFTKLSLKFNPMYITTLAQGIQNVKINATELKLVSLPEGTKNHFDDVKMTREFFAKLNIKFPNLQRLTTIYPFCCNDCPYFDGLIQPFASLTDIKLIGRINFSNFMNFIRQNPQLEKVALMYTNNMVCSDGKVFSWKLPADFVQQLDNAVPKLKSMIMFFPCVMEKPQTDTGPCLKSLEKLDCDLHGPNSWMPNLLNLSGDKMEELSLELNIEDVHDDIFEKSAHLNELKEVTINAYIQPDDNKGHFASLPVIPAQYIHSFILTHRQLKELTITIKSYLNGDHFSRNVKKSKKVEHKKLQSYYREVIEGKLNGHRWKVTGHMSEIIFSKIGA